VIKRIPRRLGFAPFQGCRLIREGALGLRVAVDPAAGGVCVAFATPKRIGSAVVRNRVRRRLRELMRARANGLPAGWYLLSVEPAAVDSNWGQLGTTLDSLLERALQAGTNAVFSGNNADRSLV